MSKKNEPTRRRVDALAEQKAHGQAVQSWLRERANLMTKLLRKLRKKRAKAAAGSRGVDRVPARYQVQRTPGIPGTEWHVEHSDANYAQRRRIHLESGRALVPGQNKPHVNPRRDGKSARAGRLRKELQA